MAVGFPTVEPAVGTVSRPVIIMHSVHYHTHFTGTWRRRCHSYRHTAERTPEHNIKTSTRGHTASKVQRPPNPIT